MAPYVTPLELNASEANALAAASLFTADATITMSLPAMPGSDAPVTDQVVFELSLSLPFAAA
jgi:hypothetical protein